MFVHIPGRWHGFVLVVVALMAVGAAKAEQVAAGTLGPNEAAFSSPRLTVKQRRVAVRAVRAAGLRRIPAGIYIPMLRPGMAGRYDIGGWHR